MSMTILTRDTSIHFPLPLVYDDDDHRIPAPHQATNWDIYAIATAWRETDLSNRRIDGVVDY